MSSQWFRGEFASWDDAASGAGSYADAAILDRVVAATRAVRDGAAAYERDGWAFVEPRHNEPLLQAVSAATPFTGGLRVVDFGGALGSLYWQHRRALHAFRPLHWCVVEQPHYVAAGRREFENAALSFWPDLDAAAAGGGIDLAVASSVLQYVRDPHGVLEALLALDARSLFFDRLSLVPGPADRLTIEQVPPELGGGTYPAWFLSEERFLSAVGGRYELVQRFPTLLEGDTPERWEVFGLTVDNQGFRLVRRDPPA